MPVKPIHTLTDRIIRCMLFDLGDTLWSRGETAAWERNEDIANRRAVVLLREGIDPAYLPMLDDFALGRRLREAIDQYIRTRIRRDLEIEPDGTRAVIETLSQWGTPEIHRDFGTKIFEALRIRIPESRPLFDDSLSTIIELHKRGFLLGIVTNRNWGGPPFLEDLRTLGLYDYFHPAAIAISGDLGRRKPSAEIFLHALNALEVRPEEAVMVGDSLSADVLGAQALGIFAIWKPKPELLKRLQALSHRADTAINAQPPTASGVLSAELSHDAPDNPLPGMHATDDDYILAQDWSRDYLDRYLRGDITPDLTIEHLSDLLEIFQQAGVQ
ncbi:MAG: HAD family hydrolase [Chloroflexi bacterium]|nr:MAG: HAD family hydrolase [Chloroflexota bacterium]